MSGSTVCLLVLLAGGPAFAQAQAQGQEASDFPLHDSTIVTSVGRDAGRALADALRHPSPRASTLLVLLRHRYTDEAVAVLSRIVSADGPELLPALRTAADNSSWWDDQRRRADISAALTKIVDSAMASATRRPRDEAAAIARQVMWLRRNMSRYTPDGWAADLRTFIEKYDGTPTALIARVELIVETVPIRQQVDEAERFAHAHEGTVAGARALYDAGFQLGSNYAITGIEPRGSDPTDRLLRVVAIARELESGRYPPCEWVARAPTLVTGFFVSDRPAPAYAPENVQRSLDAYGDFVRTHLTSLDPRSTEEAIASKISASLWKLWTLQGDPMPRAERFFDELAIDRKSAGAVRLLQAHTYLNRLRDDPRNPEPYRTRIIAILKALAKDEDDSVRRRAHAALAAELFVGGDTEQACTEFRRFTVEHPRSDWAWVASLRLGQCHEALGQWRDAADAYRRAATLHNDKPAAVLLGHAYAARALEGTGDFTTAAIEYERAVAAWFGNESARLDLPFWRRAPTRSLVPARDTTVVMKPDMELRRQELQSTIALPGGALLERARWALAHGSRRDAHTIAAQLTTQFPQSPLAQDARFVAHRADYEDALDLAAADDPRNMTGAQVRLEELSREPDDIVTSLARIARASLMAIQGTAGAEALMKDGLERWHAIQRVASPAAPGSLEADADAVRRAVFQPLGSAVYGGGWNAMTWPKSLPPFLIAPADLLVQDAAGRLRMVSASRIVPGLENTLYLSNEHVKLLETTIAILGGSLRRVPQSVMATPNQPAGASVTIMRLWNQFFPMRQGHWGGWEFATYPVVTRIEFTNNERTRASVPVIVGYSGGTVLLEKIDGEWRALEIVNRWIT